MEEEEGCEEEEEAVSVNIVNIVPLLELISPKGPNANTTFSFFQPRGSPEEEEGCEEEEEEEAVSVCRPPVAEANNPACIHQTSLPAGEMSRLKF